MTYPVKIIGAVLDVRRLTMYVADGTTITMEQGDPRLRDLMAKLLPALDPSIPKEKRFYMLLEEDMGERNHFAEAEKKMNGFVRFFKMAKSKVKELAEKFLEPLPSMVLGSTEPEKPTTSPLAELVEAEPVEEEFAAEAAPEVPVMPKPEEAPLTKSAAAVAEIMANAVPADTRDFQKTKAQPGQEEMTIVAVTEDNTIIPGVEVLSAQMAAVTADVASGKGMARFFERAASVKRGHSVEDLLKFMEKGELPIADDGCAVVYKRLNKTSEEGVFVDVHSGNVRQRVGSYVHMEERLVDSNRRKDCSNGLHVARRDYLSAFSGDVCVLAKLAPEDVIAVPEYDARKLRAKGYHIVAVLSDADASRVCLNQTLQDTELLARVIAGNHIGITQYVEITAGYGGGLKFTEVTPEDHEKSELRKASSLDEFATQEGVKATPVDARAIALATPAVPEGVPGGYADGDSYRQPAEPLEPVTTVIGVEASPDMESDALTSRMAIMEPKKRPVDVLIEAVVKNNYTITDCLALLEFKKQSKKSWTALGVQIAVWEKVVQVVNSAPAEQPVQEPAPAPVEIPEVKKAAPKKPVVKEPAINAGPATLFGVTDYANSFLGSPAERLAQILAIRPFGHMQADACLRVKKGAKKGWAALKVSDADVARIEKTRSK